MKIQGGEKRLAESISLASVKDVSAAVLSIQSKHQRVMDANAMVNNAGCFVAIFTSSL